MEAGSRCPRNADRCTRRLLRSTPCLCQRKSAPIANESKFGGRNSRHKVPHKPQCASEQFEGRSPHGLYSDTVQQIDCHVGESLNALRRLDLANDTIVVFASDNGPAREGGFWLGGGGAGSVGPRRGGRGNTFEDGIREPDVFHWPSKITPGMVTDHPASILDLMPTLAELAGAAMPPGHVIDGGCIANLLLGKVEQIEDRPFFYCVGVQFQAGRLGRWK